MKIEQFSRREQFLVGLTIFVALGVLLYSFLFEPLIRNYLLIEEQIEATKQEITKHKILLAHKDEIQSIYEQYKNYIKSSKSDAQEAANILETVSIIKGDKNILIRDMNLIRVLKTEQYRKFYIKIIAEAEFMPLSRFIYDILHSSLPLRIENFTLNLKSDKEIFSVSMIVSHITTQEETMQ